MHKLLLPLLFLFVLLILSCSEDVGIPGPDKPGVTSTGMGISLCEDNPELEIKSDGQSCDVGGFGLCDVLIIDDTQYI